MFISYIRTFQTNEKNEDKLSLVRNIFEYFKMNMKAMLDFTEKYKNASSVL